MKYVLTLLFALTVSNPIFADIKIVFSEPEFADLQKRIDECEKSGDQACIFEIMREIVARMSVTKPSAPKPQGAPEIEMAENALCTTKTATEMILHVRASRSASVKCFYNNHSFSKPATYNGTMWACSPWTRGNPTFKLTVKVNGESFETNETEALKMPCSE